MFPLGLAFEFLCKTSYARTNYEAWLHVWSGRRTSNTRLPEPKDLPLGPNFEYQAC
jgi:hypothetical protein